MVVRRQIALLALIGCIASACGVARGPSVAPSAGTSAAVPERAAMPRRWLLHAFLNDVVSPGHGSALEYTASYVGPTRIERSLKLPRATVLSWSPDGRWLALCSPELEGSSGHTLYRASALGFDGDRVSEPLPLGACASFDWAPTGGKLLVRNDKGARLWHFTDSAPSMTEMAEVLAEPVDWSPTGRYFLARLPPPDRRMVVVHAEGPAPRVERLELGAVAPRSCRWGPTDALGCVVESSDGTSALLLQAPYSSAAFLSATSHVPHPPARFQSYDWATERVLVYELGGARGVHALRPGGASTQLFLPGESDGLENWRLSPAGRWLLDGASGSVRLWDLLSDARPRVLSGLSGDLLNPRWSPSGEHALLGVRQRHQRALEGDVWLVAHATHQASLTRVASPPAGQTSFARFSPGSQWVLISFASDAIPPASAGASVQAAAPSLAVHVASGARSEVPRAEWASDDSAFVASDPERRRVLLVRVQSASFGTPEPLAASAPGALRVLWQPGPGSRP
jgi:WD40 repeat protein